jgi:hypothetical protein
MADVGDLEKFPLEIRLPIYAHLLVENKKIPVKRIRENKQEKPARMDNHRNTKHPKKLYDSQQKRWVDAPPYTTSLLLVNKAVSAEATQVLYGLNRFVFEHAGALRCFLESTGDSKLYLRHLAIAGRGVLYRGSLIAMKRSIGLLQQTRSLRSLQISHAALCGGPRRCDLHVEINTLVSVCAPLLKSLKATFDKQNLDVSILDVVKIELPSCHYNPKVHRGLSGYLYHFITTEQPLLRGLHCSDTRQAFWCTCPPEAAEDKNRKFVEDLKKEISTLLQLDVGKEERKEGE